MAGRFGETRAGASEKYVGRNAEMLVKRTHHVHVQGATAVEDLVHPRSPTETVRDVGGRELGLVHAEPDRLDGIRRVD